MSGSIYKKGLVVGIIVLFICVGVQPAFAEVSIISKSDVEDDCDCNVDFIDNSEVLGKYERLSIYLNEIIPSLDRPICESIIERLQYYWNYALYCAEQANHYEVNTEMWLYWYYQAMMCVEFIAFYFFIGVLLLCWPAPPPEPEL